MVKALTGEDTLKVRLPYQEPWSLPPCAKFLMVANKRPNIDVFDTGLRRRLLIIECDPPLPDDKRDAHLEEKLRAEKSGILNWMLNGWREVRQRGLDVPDAIRRATDQFFRDKNEISAFWDECVEKELGAKVTKDRLYEPYREFCFQEGIAPRGKNEFGHLVKTICNLEDGRDGRTRFWRGIRFRCDSKQDNNEVIQQMCSDLLPV